MNECRVVSWPERSIAKTVPRPLGTGPSPSVVPYKRPSGPSTSRPDGFEPVRELRRINVENVVPSVDMVNTVPLSYGPPPCVVPYRRPSLACITPPPHIGLPSGHGKGGRGGAVG